MIAGTHIAFASALYLGGAALFEYRPELTGWALAIGAAVLPDLDLPTSKLGRALFWLSTRLERAVGHRTLTHSLLALLLVAALAGLLYPYRPAWCWALVGGYWSHLWLDMLNLRGIDLFWPSPVRVVMPGNRRYRLEVGSKAEMVLLTLLVLVSLALYPVSSLGFRMGLQHLLGSFAMASDAFRKHAGTHWYRLRLEATDTLTLQHIACDCLVVGPWRQGLILEQAGQLRSVGTGEADRLYPIRAQLIEGEPLRVIAQRVDMRGRSLGWLIERLTPRQTHFISGELRLGGHPTAPVATPARYQPVRIDGQRLRLRYARPQDLQRYRDRVAIEGMLYVQLWLKPGEAAVALRLGGERQDSDPIPEALKPFL